MDALFRRGVQRLTGDSSLLSGGPSTPTRDTIIRDTLLAELSELCAELQSLAAAASANDDALTLADGLSVRIQAVHTHIHAHPA